MWSTIFIGLCFASVDCAIEYSLTKFERHIGCATIGCFASPQYKIYWGASNMVSFKRHFLEKSKVQGDNI